MQFKQGEMIGPWQVSSKIGQGGNGVVYEATDGKRIAAVKVLSQTKNSKRVSRFSDEIRAMQVCHGLPGVLPLYASFLPAENDKQPPWLAMALAVPLINALGSAPKFEQVIASIKGVAAALVSVHAIGISHRDIKPNNLFHFDGIWAVGDFGLADFDGKESETALMEKVGPIYYIAPEMLNGAAAADGKAADVYSLAKTMWVLGTGQRYPQPGHQLASTFAMTISAYTDHPRAALLDKLIDCSTRFDPAERPTMQQFLHEIEAWIAPSTPNLKPTQSDMRPYLRLLEGRLSKIQVHEQAKAVANEVRTSEGIRLRERFRDIGSELCNALAEAGFMSANLQIDNVTFGFLIYTTLPYNLEEGERHQLKVAVTTSPSEPDATNFVLQASYQYGHQSSGKSKEKIIWQSERTFLSGGSGEDQEISAMIEDLRGQLLPAIQTVFSKAGLI